MWTQKYQRDENQGGKEGWGEGQKEKGIRYMQLRNRDCGRTWYRQFISQFKF